MTLRAARDAGGVPGRRVRPDRLLGGPLLPRRARLRARRDAIDDAAPATLLAVHWRPPTRELPAHAATRCTSALTRGSARRDYSRADRQVHPRPVRPHAAPDRRRRPGRARHRPRVPRGGRRRRRDARSRRSSTPPVHRARRCRRSSCAASSTTTSCRSRTRRGTRTTASTCGSAPRSRRSTRRAHVVLARGETLRYDACVLATGAEPTRAAGARRDRGWVLLLRSLADRPRAARRAAEQREAAIVDRLGLHRLRGRGLAGHARARRSRWSATRPIPQRRGSATRPGGGSPAGWSELGVDAARLRRALGERGPRDGADRGDLILMAAGVRPRRARRAAGLAVRTAGSWSTSTCARAPRTSTPPATSRSRTTPPPAATLAVEHWGEALNMGEIAGRTIAGEDAQWDVAPGFWSTIGEHTLKYVAWGDGFDEARLVDHGGGAFTVWYGRDGITVGVLTHERDEDYERGRDAGRDGSRRCRDAARVRRRARARRGGADRRVHRRARRAAGRRRATSTRSLLVLDRCTDATEHAPARPPRRAEAARDPAPTAPGVGHARRRAWTSPRALLAARRPDRHHRRRLARPRRTGCATQLDAVAQRRAGDRRADRARRRHDLPPAALAPPRAPRPRAAARALPAARARASTTSSPAPRSASPPRPTRGSAGWSRATALEDEGFERALRRHGVPIERLGAVRVTTSGRRLGRAPRGLAVDLRARGWLAERSYDARDFPLDELLARKTRDDQRRSCPRARSRRTLGACSTRSRRSTPAGRRDCWSSTPPRPTARADRAARGVRVADESELQPGSAPRWARATRCGAASRPPPASSSLPGHRHRGLPRRLRARPARPAAHRRRVDVREGPLPPPVEGRRHRRTPTAAAASPSCSPAPTSTSTSRSWPASASRWRARSRPRRRAARALPFPAGYGVEIAMLIDALRAVGLERMAQVDLGTRQNRHQPLSALARMALEVLAAAERRIHGATIDAVPGPLLVPGGGRLRGAPRRARRAPAARTGGRGAARLGLMRAYARRRAFNSASCTWRSPEVIASRTRRS